MIARALIVLAAALVASTASAQEPQPIVRVRVGTPPPLLVGQQIRLDVEILVPNFFMGSPVLPHLDLDGAVITLSDDSVNMNETVRGTEYAGIRKNYLFTASAAGTYTLPSSTVRVTYAATPGKPPTVVSVPMPETTLEVTWPAGIEPVDVPEGMLVARVTVSQQLDRDATTLHVGDAITRVVEVTAERTQAMLIPPSRFAAPDGVRVYTRDPVLQDQQADRGGLVAGHRTDAATYVFQKPGTYELPAIEIPWFDVGARQARTATAPAVRVTVAPAATAAAAIAPEAPPPPAPPPPPRRNWTRVALLSALALATALVLWQALRRIPLWLSQYRERRARVAASEPALFERLRHACQAGDAPSGYRALIAWAQIRWPTEGARSDWRLTSGNADFTAAVVQLERHLYAGGPTTSWSGQALSAACLAARQHPASRESRGAHHLPELNP